MKVSSQDNSIQSLLSATSTTLTTSLTGASSTGIVPTDTSDISSGAQLMDQLQALEKSNPDQFKAVMNDVASQLKTQASSASGTQASFLTDLASKFQQAGASGDLSALQPTSQSSSASASSGGAQGSTGHHHHHAKYTDASGSSADSLQSIIQNAIQQTEAATGASQTQLS